MTTEVSIKTNRFSCTKEGLSKIKRFEAIRGSAITQNTKMISIVDARDALFLFRSIISCFESFILLLTTFLTSSSLLELIVGFFSISEDVPNS